MSYQESISRLAQCAIWFYSALAILFPYRATISQEFQPKTVQEYLRSWDTFELEFRQREVTPDYQAGSLKGTETVEEGEIERSSDAWRTIRRTRFTNNPRETVFFDETELVETSAGILVISHSLPVRKPADAGEFDLNLVREKGEWKLSVMASSTWQNPDHIPGIFCKSFPDDSKRNTLDVLLSGGADRQSNVRFLDRSCTQLDAMDSQGSYSAIVDSSTGEIYSLSWIKSSNQIYRGKRVNEIINGELGAATKLAYRCDIESKNSKGDEYVLKKIFTTSYQKGDIVKLTTINLKVRARPKTSPVAITSAVPNGTPVRLMDRQQIRAEFRDGKIVRTYDGQAVENLAETKFQPSRSLWRSSLLWATLAIFVVSLFGYWTWRKSKSQR